MFGSLSHFPAAAGGLLLRGLRDSGGVAGYALTLQGFLGETADTTKSAGAAAVIDLTAAVKSGSSVTNVGSNGNLMMIRNYASCKFIFDAEGEMHSDAVIGGGNDWDEWDDSCGWEPLPIWGT